MQRRTIHWLSLLCGLPVGLFTLMLLLFYSTAVGSQPAAQAAQPRLQMFTAPAQDVVTASGLLTGTLPLSYSYLPFISRQDLVVAHGGFEGGAGIWQEFSRKGHLLVKPEAELSVPPHSGHWAARLGAVDDEIAMLSQGITIPKEQSCLVYWQWTVSSDACRADYGGVGINGNWLVKESLCAGTATGQWVRRQVNMSHYITQPIVLNFAVTTDYSSPSIMYIDDIAFAPDASCTSHNQNAVDPAVLTVMASSHPIIPLQEHPTSLSAPE